MKDIQEKLDAGEISEESAESLASIASRKPSRSGYVADLFESTFLPDIGDTMDDWTHITEDRHEEFRRENLIYIPTLKSFLNKE